MLDVKQINKLIGVNESYQAPDQLMQIMLKKGDRELLFRKFLELDSNLSFDWFREYFQKVQADRGEKKQDFTPQSAINVLTGLFGNKATGMYFEPTAGTGGIVVSQWWRDCLQHNPLPGEKNSYATHLYFYQVEELSDAALPFLLFNLTIRGMNATVFHGDSLERKCKQIYFIQNDDDDFLHFSSVNVMPHSKDVAQEFDVRDWLENEIVHLESTVTKGPVANAINKLTRGGEHAAD